MTTAKQLQLLLYNKISPEPGLVPQEEQYPKQPIVNGGCLE